MRAGLLATAAIAVALAGCGGDDEKKTDSAPSGGNAAREGADARSNARNAASLVESCFAENGDYTPCAEPQLLTDGGLEHGRAPGQVEVSDVTPTTYIVTAYISNSQGFLIAKAADGTMPRSCDAPEEAGCKSGTW
jgi:hypothetical protein